MTTAECTPRRRGDRWMCARSQMRGGACDPGPLPDGKCPLTVIPCQPVRSLLAKRGLVARWGLVRGILLTSLLFAVVHVHPAHAIALLPLAIFIHLAYLTTRSIFAPVLIHFLNNALAVTVVKHPEWLEVESLSEEVAAPPEVVVIAAMSVITASLLMWHTRVQYRLSEGEVWSTGYDTVELPPPNVAAVRESGRTEYGLVVLTIVFFLGFSAIDIFVQL